MPPFIHLRAGPTHSWWAHEHLLTAALIDSGGLLRAFAEHPLEQLFLPTADCVSRSAHPGDGPAANRPADAS